MYTYSDYSLSVMNEHWDNLNYLNRKLSLTVLSKMIGEIVLNNAKHYDKTITEFNKLLNKYSNTYTQRMFIVYISIIIIVDARNKIKYESQGYEHLSKIIDAFVKEFHTIDSLVLVRELFQYNFNEVSIKDWFDKLLSISEKKAFIADIKSNMIDLKKVAFGLFDEDEKQIIQFLDLLAKDTNKTDFPCKKRNLNFELLIKSDEESVSDFIDELLDKLKHNRISKENIKTGFIHKNVKKPDLRKVFFKHKHSSFKPIIWIGTIDELNLFIKLMFDNRKIKKCWGKWEIAACCFVMERAEKELTPGRLSRATRHDKIIPPNKKALEKILNLLPG